ncbi:MAG: hypothetical protein KBF12_13010 [Sebaldella sp.]|nr:hypothetical protein [Sebaldella sp.]
MAIYKPTLNFLNTVKVETKYSKSYVQDPRDALFLSTVKDVEPTIITEVTDLLELGFTTSDVMYKKVSDALTQGGIDTIIIYGVDVSADAVNLTPEKIMEQYEDEPAALNYSILILDVVNLESAKKWAKAFKPLIDKKHLFIQLDKVSNTLVEINAFKLEYAVSNITTFVADNDENLDNVDAITWARARNRDLGSYIVHSTEVRGVRQPDFTKTEQMNMKDYGVNFISNPIRGKFHIQNGLSNSGEPVELHLYKLWELWTLKERLTRLQIEIDKIPTNQSGFEMLEATIKGVIFTAKDMGIAKAISGDPFAVEVRTDADGNNFNYLLGKVELQFPSEEDIRNSDFKFRYFHTLLDGVRYVDVAGYITQTGELVLGGNK